ncbi:hypothetical protein SADUNF_Sadunf05G0107500 [Salix dunnii]|uniref:Uncharacterized protein n=1 Tax=Salix dunnii TaxID=1413687 RepID=A0A835KCG4_9ROSI|nr:hypothetical protein SADUNF_Sadunf05G0107500 [Salix dunnii]
MEKFLKPCDKEYMRMAMLKHEETLKEQVLLLRVNLSFTLIIFSILICELHRLYRIQKIMMRNIESSRPNERNQELWRYSRPNHACDMQQKSRVKLDLEWPSEDCVAESNADRIVELIEESEIQLTLGPSSYDTRKKPETPLTSDSGPGRSSTSTGSSHINRNKREELRGCELGLFQVPGMTLGYQNESIGVEEQLRQDRLEQPPWLCQVLSLNMA